MSLRLAGRAGFLAFVTRAAAVTLWLLAIGCVPSDESSASPVASAGLEETASADQATRDWTLRTWIAGCSSGEDLWLYRNSSTVVCEPEGRRLEGGNGRFDWNLSYPAEEIDALVAEGGGLDRAAWRLWWAGPGEPFTAERSAQADRGVSSGEVRFELAGRPSWRGELRRLRLVWSGEATGDARLTVVRIERRLPVSQDRWKPGRGDRVDNR